eukprot:3278812-Prymnesium_polylepis.1
MSLPPHRQKSESVLATQLCDNFYLLGEHARSELRLNLALHPNALDTFEGALEQVRTSVGQLEGEA